MDDAMKGVLVIVGLIYFGYRLGENSNRRLRPTLLDKAENVTEKIDGVIEKHTGSKEKE